MDVDYAEPTCIGCHLESNDKQSTHERNSTDGGRMFGEYRIVFGSGTNSDRASIISNICDRWPMLILSRITSPLPVKVST